VKEVWIVCYRCSQCHLNRVPFFGPRIRGVFIAHEGGSDIRPCKPRQFTGKEERQMRWKHWKVPIFAALGFCYGITLALLAFLAAGAGHGTTVLFGLFSSPLGLTQRIG